jgi:hypothetical protein
MKVLTYKIIIISFLVAIIACTSEPLVAEKKLSMTASTSMMISALVIGIDHDTRELTLKSELGDEYSYTASAEARNLDQVNVGDRVTVEYVHAIAIDVLDADSQLPEFENTNLLARSEKGEKPAVEAVQTHQEVLTITDINIANGTFDLKDEDGDVKQFTAANPKNLHKAAVGDLVIIADTQTLALLVEEIPSE